MSREFEGNKDGKSGEGGNQRGKEGLPHPQGEQSPPIPVVRKSRFSQRGETVPVKPPVGEGRERGRKLIIESGMVGSWKYARTRQEARRDTDVEDEGWGIYKSPVSDYETRTFGSFLPHGSLVKLVEGKPSLVVVDLMAPSETLVDLFTQLPPDAERQGIAVSLRDYRTQKEKARDEKMSIKQITGDLTKTKTWRQVEAALDGKKADLIMERGYGAMGYLPTHPQFFRYAAQRLWNMLRENGGVLLAEVDWPLFNHIRDNNWKEKLADHNVALTTNSYTGAVRLVRNPDSPSVLPAV